MSEYDHHDPLKLISLLDKRDARIAKLEAFVAAYDTLSGAIHSGDNYRIARAIAATDEARQVLKESDE